MLQKTRGSNEISTTADIRFLSLKIFTDIVIQYLNDDTIYDPTKDTNSEQQDTTTRQLSELLQQ